MSRKDRIKGLYDDSSSSALTAVNSGGRATETPPERTLAGPVRTMGLVLEQRGESGTASLQPAKGEAVVEIDPNLVEPSFVRDRFKDADPGQLRALEASIEANGQEVPILVRPHPGQSGHYQAAYGHRRLDVLKRLGRKVRAIVKPLTDQDLIVAQGIENSVRQDLSYIERSAFAAALEQRSFERAAIMAALSVDKTELSRMLAITRAIPADLVGAIGAAPATGRRRWMELAELLRDARRLKAAERLMTSDSFESYDSDTRFLRVFAAAADKQRKQAKPKIWKTSAGKPAAKISASEKAYQITFDRSVEPEFGAYVAEQLDVLHRAFQARPKGAD